MPWKIWELLISGLLLILIGLPTLACCGTHTLDGLEAAAAK